jgi:hypothetical protein
MNSLEDLKKQRDSLNDSIKIMLTNLEKNRAKMAEYDAALLDAEDMGYDEETLERGLTSVATSIGNIEKVLDGERARLVAVEQAIQHSENVLRAHHICVHERDHGDHDWEVLAMFDKFSPHVGKWCRRKCRDCGTEQRLGHE